MYIARLGQKGGGGGGGPPTHPKINKIAKISWKKNGHSSPLIINGKRVEKRHNTLHMLLQKCSNNNQTPSTQTFNTQNP
jgi:hypothetical protein